MKLTEKGSQALAEALLNAVQNAFESKEVQKDFEAWLKDRHASTQAQPSYGEARLYAVSVRR